MSHKKTFQLLSVPDVLALPPAEWLIRPLFPTHAQVLLYASPESYKSFVALAWAFAVATGRAWLGHDVRRGPVIYVAREGITGMKQRILAWQQAAEVEDIEHAFFLKDDLQLRTDCDAFIDAIRVVRPVLVVIDTLSRTFVGADENNSKDVGEWVAASRRIQEETGATVLTVHHTVKKEGKKGPVERGHSLLRGAMDTMLGLTRQKGDNVVVLTCEKQKDAEPFSAIHLRSEVLQVGASIDGSPVTSLVLSRSGTGGKTTPKMNATQSRVLEALGSEESRTTQELIQATGIAERTFHTAVKELVAQGRVNQPTKGRYQLLPTADACRSDQTH